VAAITSHEDIINELKNKIYRPVYLLMGEEPYFIDKIVDYIEDNVLTEDEKSFNQTVVYGKDADVRSIDAMSKRFPMMSNYQVVIVKEAQDLKGIGELAFYAEKPLKSTILVLSYKYKDLEKSNKFYKAVDKNGVVFQSKKLYDNKIPAWITSQLKNKSLNIKPEAAAMMSEFIGADLCKIENELNKLEILLPKGSTITPEHVEKNIGINKDYNVFEFNNAIGAKNILKANKIATYFGENPKENPPIVVIDRLYTFFTQILRVHVLGDKADNRAIASELGINEYFVKDFLIAKRNYSLPKVTAVISLLREYDLKGKGVGGEISEKDLLRELAFKIMH